MTRKDLSSDQRALESEARAVFKLLKKKKLKFVLAESCTAGLIPATLAQIPGASDVLCGSTVVYRNDTKARWLGVSRKTLKDPGAVSAECALEMAQGVLTRTPEADFAVSITGHLGPAAPQGEAGNVFIALILRSKKVTTVQQFQILSPSERTPSARIKRQVLASLALLFMVRSLLKTSTFAQLKTGRGND